MIRLGIATLTILVCGMTTDAADFKKKNLIGTWEYVETYTQFTDGRKEPQFGLKPAGRFVIMEDGLYSHIIMAPDLPKVSSGRFKSMTIEEAERMAEGVLAHYGTWTADEKNGTFKVVIEKSSYPNIEGAEQIRTITKLTKDELEYINNLSVAAPGAIVVARLRRKAFVLSADK